MPVKIKKVDGHQVSHGGKVSAKSTTKVKAERQANLLRAVAHGWKPTGKPARDKRKSSNEDMHHQAKLGSWWNKRRSL
jgi:hypothetical protein